jgi:hypothetical protein
LLGGVSQSWKSQSPSVYLSARAQLRFNGELPALEIVSHPVLSLKSSAPNNLAVSVLLWRWGRFFWAKKNPPT